MLYPGYEIRDRTAYVDVTVYDTSRRQTRGNIVSVLCILL